MSARTGDHDRADSERLIISLLRQLNDSIRMMAGYDLPEPRWGTSTRTWGVRTIRAGRPVPPTVRQRSLALVAAIGLGLAALGAAVIFLGGMVS